MSIFTTFVCFTGEWGGSGLDVPGKPDATWNSAFVPYIQQLGATDTFFWALNPTSVDTGGILNADWATPVQLKLNLLATLQPSPAKVTLTNGIPSSIFPGGSQTAYSLTPGTNIRSYFFPHFTGLKNSIDICYLPIASRWRSGVVKILLKYDEQVQGLTALISLQLSPCCHCTTLLKQLCMLLNKIVG